MREAPTLVGGENPRSFLLFVLILPSSLAFGHLMGVKEDMLRTLALTISLIALMGCSPSAGPDSGSDPAAIEAVSLNWKRAFNARDVSAVSALYADDAVLSAPNMPIVKGKAAIKAYFEKTILAFSTAGVTVTDAPMGRGTVSGNLGYLWETYRIVDRSGATTDTGKLVTLYRRDAGKWLIVGDTWNSDGRPETDIASR